MPTTYASIPAAPADQPEVLPPCAGSWLRNPDGSLTPADDATAAAAGLLIATPASPTPKTTAKE